MTGYWIAANLAAPRLRSRRPNQRKAATGPQIDSPLETKGKINTELYI